MTKEPSVFEKIQAREKENAVRWEEVKKIAQAQGLCLVQLTARRHIVVRVDFRGASLSGHEGKRFTYLSGEKVFGPATWEACRQYIFDNVETVPESLRRSLMCLECHVVSVAVEFRDLDSLERACQRLGWMLHRNRTHAWYGHWVDDSAVPEGLFADRAEYDRVCALSRTQRREYMTKLINSSEHAIRMPTRQYEIGLIQQADGHYRLAYDWIMDGKSGLNFNDLTNAYAVELEIAKAKENGYSYTETTLEDGSIELLLTSYT